MSCGKKLHKAVKLVTVAVICDRGCCAASRWTSSSRRNPPATSSARIARSRKSRTLSRVARSTQGKGFEFSNGFRQLRHPNRLVRHVAKSFHPLRNGDVSQDSSL